MDYYWRKFDVFDVFDVLILLWILAASRDTTQFTFCRVYRTDENRLHSS